VQKITTPQTATGASSVESEPLDSGQNREYFLSKTGASEESFADFCGAVRGFCEETSIPLGAVCIALNPSDSDFLGLSVLGGLVAVLPADEEVFAAFSFVLLGVVSGAALYERICEIEKESRP